MSSPTVLATLPADQREGFFAPGTRERLESLADVTWNEREEQWSEDDLADRLPGVEIVLTGWGSPAFTPAALESADELELVAHVAGSVATYVTDALYDRGVTVCSANRTMARFVAEHALAHALSAQRDLARTHESMRAGEYEQPGNGRSLYDATVGLVGLGTVGRYLLPLLAPFDVSVRLYDPYVAPAEIAGYGFVEKASLTGALEDADVVSIHAARTPETVGMLGADELARIPDGALLVNTARAAIVDRDALLAELSSGRLRAALDVYHEEPLPEDSPLRDLDDVQLTPHLGGNGPHRNFGAAIVDEIERHVAGEALQHEIPREQANLMTR